MGGVWADDQTRARGILISHDHDRESSDNNRQNTHSRYHLETLKSMVRENRGGEWGQGNTERYHTINKMDYR